MSDVFDFKSHKRKQLAKKAGVSEFDLYLNHLTSTAVSQFTGKALNDVRITDNTYELCQGDEEKLSRIVGSVSATLNVMMFSRDWNKEDPFALYPTVFSIIEAFYIKTEKQNKQFIPTEAQLQARIQASSKKQEDEQSRLKKEEEEQNRPFLF